MIENIDEIRGISLIDTISQYTKLERAGSQYRGLCPFHDERTASFYVSDGKGYHCFGCGAKGGNVIDFIMSIENKSFPEAVEYLANYSGIDVHDVHNVHAITTVNTVNKREHVNKKESREIDYINPDLIRTNIERYRHNTLYQYFTNKYGEETAGEVFNKYGVGTCNTPIDSSTLFIQRDVENHVRQLKAIKYNPDGHRDRSLTPLIIGKRISGKENLHQCFFGEHLISLDNSKPIAIVESEKTAMMASIHYPQFIWIATGGKSGCSMIRQEVNKVLRGRIIHLFPDRDGIEDWRKQSIELNKQGIQSFLNGLIEKYPQYGEKADIGDIISLIPYHKFPKWLAEAKASLSDYEDGIISKEQRLDALQTNFESSGLSYQEYVRQTNGGLSWELEAKENLERYRTGEYDYSIYEDKQIDLIIKHELEPEMFVNWINELVLNPDKRERNSN